MVVQNVDLHSFLALLLKQPGQGCSGFVIPEYIELEADEFLGSTDCVEDGSKGFFSSP